jgi:plasmid stability protein
MATERNPSDEATEIEDQPRRLHRGDAFIGGVGFFRSWESLAEATKEISRAQVQPERRPLSLRAATSGHRHARLGQRQMSAFLTCTRMNRDIVDQKAKVGLS